jgi:ABC-type lipoprotein release transport system permease subunit
MNSMNLKLGWRNIWRNKRRTVLTIAAIAFACILLVFMLSFQIGTYDTMINASVGVHTGHLQVQARGYHEKRQIRQMVRQPAEMVGVIRDLPGVTAHTERGNAFSLVSSAERTYGALVIGIDPQHEAETSTLRKLIRKGRYLDTADTDAALIGKLLARNLQVDIGDELTVLRQGSDGSVAAAVFTIKGIYSSGMDEFDRSAIHVPLGYFQDVFTLEGNVHEIVVTVQSLADVHVVKQALERKIAADKLTEKLVVMDWMDLLPGLAQGIAMDLVSGLIIYVILILVVAFSILNTFLMAILERTREFGVMMALGTTPGRLVKMVMLESMLMTLVGIFTGIVLGVALTWYFQVHGIVLAGSSEMLKQYGISGALYPRLTWFSIITGPTLVFLITLGAAIYPALKIKKLKPVDALMYT